MIPFEEVACDLDPTNEDTPSVDERGVGRRGSGDE
jgi:hypothetical protein